MKINKCTTFKSNDFRYTLSCVVKDSSGNLKDGETDYAFAVEDMGNVYDDCGDNHVRPAVTLKAGSVITEGEGTHEKPYIIG